MTTKNNAPKCSAKDRALDLFAEMLIERLSTIQQDWKKPWFTEGSMSWPKNLNGREYNGMNAFMLMMLCQKMGYKIPIFCTFDRVQSMNYTLDKQGKKQHIKDENGEQLPNVCIKKGEKSFPVFITTFTTIHGETKERIKYEDYLQLSEERRGEYNVYPKLQVYNVFCIEQTNMKEARPDFYAKLEEKYGEKVPEKKDENDMYSFEAVDNIIAGNKWICPIEPTYGDNAYYSISGKKIVVPEKKQFKSGESFYSNLFHEMAHSTGAEDQLNRLKPVAFGSHEYAREELVAEMTAALVSQRYGISKCVKEDSLPYLKSWLDKLKEDAKFIKTCLLDVKRASSMITKCIDSEMLESFIIVA